MSMPPYIKQTASHIHRSHPPKYSLSLISHVSLSLIKTSTLSLRDLVMAPAFFNGIDMLSSPIFYLYSFDLYLYSCFFAFYIYIYSYSLQSIYIYLCCHILLGRIFCAYILCSHFLAFYRSGGMNNGPPPPQEPDFHPGDEPFAPNVAIPRFPVPAIV